MKEKNKLVLKDKTRALVLVAHPDDEVIWMGGTILRFPQVDWTVFSLCRKSDKDREPKFQRVCKELQVEGIITDVEDEDVMSLKESVEVFKKTILDNLKDKQFDVCFTHNDNGEYGHERHVGVHLAVQGLIKEKKMPCRQICFFNYKRLERKILPMVPAENSAYVIELTPKEYEKKRRVVAEMYGYPYEGIDVSLCTNVEAFKRINN